MHDIVFLKMSCGELLSLLPCSFKTIMCVVWSIISMSIHVVHTPSDIPISIAAMGMAPKKIMPNIKM